MFSLLANPELFSVGRHLRLAKDTDPLSNVHKVCNW